MQKILLIGNKGFLGQHVEKRLAQEFEIIGWDKQDGKRLSDLPTLNDSEIKIIVHINGIGDIYYANQYPKEVFETNTFHMVHVMETAKRFNAKVIAASSEHVNVPYSNPYAASKACQEIVGRALSNFWNVPLTLLRLTSAYGPGMRDAHVIPKFIKMAKEGKDLTIQGDGLQHRQFTYTTDVAEAFYCAIKSNQTGTFNIASNEVVTIKQLAEILSQKYKVGVIYTPARKGEEGLIELDPSKTKEVLGWEAKINFKEGLAELMKLF